MVSILVADYYKLEFNELVEDFENEQIDYFEFKDKLSEFGQFAIEVISEEVFNYWYNIRPDYVAFKKFNQNENQLVLF